MTTTRTLTCEVTPGQIKAALLFAAQLDVRGYLNGICIEHTDKGTRLIATDGNRLICIRIDETPVVGAPQRYVVSRNVLESLVKGFGKVPSMAFVWEQTNRPDPTREGVTIVGLASIHVHGIATTDLQDNLGKFPEYLRIIPESCSGITAQFNTDYITDCAKARKALGISFPHVIPIAHNGTGAAIVEIADCAFAIVMPMKLEPLMTAPQWFTTKPQAENKKAA